MTALYSSAYRFSVDDDCQIILQLLLAQGSNIDAKDQQTGYTLLHYAAVSGNANIIPLLFTKKCQLNARSKKGLTTLRVAALNGNFQIASLLLKSGAKHNILTERQETALCLAIRSRGALPGALDELGRTPLHFAAKTGSFRIATSLLRSSGNNCLSMFTLTETEGFRPLHFAVENGSEDIVQLFLNNGFPIHMSTATELKSLHIAVLKQDERMIRLLLKYAADVNAAGKSVFESPLYLAAQMGNLKIVRILSEASLTRSSKWIEAYFPLYIAAYQGHQAVVKMLLSKGVDPNANLGNYLTPLHAAAHKGHSKIVELLLEYGAEVNPKNIKAGPTSTPLLAAVHAGHEEIIFCLLDRGTEVNVRLRSEPEKLSSSLQSLLIYGGYMNSEIQGSDLKVRFTPLHFAVESFTKKKFHRNFIQSLLKCGAKVNLFSERGLTPLNIAVDKNLESVVGWLIAAGADVNVQDFLLHTSNCPQKCNNRQVTTGG
ncbi:ankyrin-3-like [Belonocnema kinseyi]|uniref:ankyrin-3-like n=1 Tax=Belonocnema kinseyi TaxID=2817044 RepID=UPI00143E0B8F|nr:ankyrin-3-like [Belonocnema kinseyi]